MRPSMTKFTLIVTAVLFAVLFVDGWIIGSSLRQFSRNAQAQFPGNRVEALIALVKCDSCNRRDRNNAVWALGQLDDQRALPVLESCVAGNSCGSLDRDTVQLALRHLRHEDHNRSEAFLWRWMLPKEV
jgi:HEAT repeat protein